MYTKRFAFLGAIAMVAMVGCETSTGPENDAVQVTSEALAVETSVEDVFDIPIPPATEPSGVFGSSKVNRNKNGATGKLHTSGLTAGNAYTMWMIVFNNPKECAGAKAEPKFSCLEPDLSNPAVEGDVIFVTGHVAGDDGEGTFAGRVAKDDTSKSLFFNSFGNTDAPGLKNLLGAEIHLVVRDHGPKISGLMPGQIHTFEGGCTAGSSFGLGLIDGGYTCADILASIHPAP